MLHSGFVGCHLRSRKAQQRDGNVQAESGESRDRDVIDPEQVEAGKQAAQNSPGDVPTVEESQPRYAIRRRLDPTGHSGQCRSHEDRWRQQTDCRGEASQEEADEARTGPCGVNAANQGHSIQHQDPDDTDSEFEKGVHAQRVVFGGNKTWQQVTAKAHASHKRSQQHTQRH